MNPAVPVFSTATFKMLDLEVISQYIATDLVLRVLNIGITCQCHYAGGYLVVNFTGGRLDQALFFNFLLQVCRLPPECHRLHPTVGFLYLGLVGGDVQASLADFNVPTHRGYTIAQRAVGGVGVDLKRLLPV